MSKRKSLVLACLALSALPFISGCGQGSDGVSSAQAQTTTAPPSTGPVTLQTISQQLNQLLAQTTDLSGVTQNWDKNLPSASRFTVLAAFNNQAVRDNNTGLVWEQAPDTTHTVIWSQAIVACANKTVGGTAGWRLPSVIELKSVLDPALAAPFVPATVFTGVQSFTYWSASTVADIPTDAWFLNFQGGQVEPGQKTPTPIHYWCVRGPMQESVY